jgi:hypothetical protein
MSRTSRPREGAAPDSRHGGKASIGMVKESQRKTLLRLTKTSAGWPLSLSRDTSPG